VELAGVESSGVESSGVELAGVELAGVELAGVGGGISGRTGVKWVVSVGGVVPLDSSCRTLAVCHRQQVLDLEG
jgi:hypothetical protein